MNPLDTTCPVCKAKPGENCLPGAPGFQHLPRAFAVPEIMAAEGQAKLLPSATVEPHNGEPHACVRLPDGSKMRVLLHANENITEAFARRRLAVYGMAASLQRELDQLDHAIDIIARETHA